MSRGLVEIIGSIFAGRRKGNAGPAGVELKLPGNGEIASIYSGNPHSSILASVLTRAKDGTAEPRTKPGSTPTSDNRSAPVSKTVGMGDELRKSREIVLASGAQLAALSDPIIADYVNRLLAMIETQHCSIAFIGQMNAGKSSLINAFIGMPRYLPTEITPWTTVVTNLYFGIPKLPTSGALFEFFNQTEWQQLAEGSARVRALTERLVPNFPWKDFYRQVGNLREAAEQKLGARYGELLGTQHAVPEVTLDVLERYIAAESPLGDLDEGSAGEFSMITKAAHLYSDLASFFYPTVVIDTPGVNDPFLVRDEITRQNLERANVFVIVVTARQPLSNADLDLLRILRGLKKGNIIVFVNKVDELGSAGADVAPIRERIAGLLKKEYPAAVIPIIVGSALWAEIALQDDVAEKRAVAAFAGLESTRSLSMADDSGGFWLSDPSIENTMLTDGILMRSGVADLALAVSEMFRGGTIANSITYAASVLNAIARNGSARAAENASLAERLARDGEAANAATMLSARLERLRGTLDGVDSRIDAMAAGFDTVLDDCQATLLDALRSTVAGCVAELGPEGAARPAPSSRDERAPLVVRLRSELERKFLTSFQQALQQITDGARATEVALREQLAIAASVLDIDIVYPDLPALKGSPSLSALSEPVATDLGGLMRGEWGSKPLALPDRAEEMQAFITAEFEAIIGKLARSAEDELSRTIVFILDHMRVTVLRALQAIIEEQQSVLLAYASPAPGGKVGTAGSRAPEPPHRREGERVRGESFAALADHFAAAIVSQ